MNSLDGPPANHQELRERTERFVRGLITEGLLPLGAEDEIAINSCIEHIIEGFDFLVDFEHVV